MPIEIRVTHTATADAHRGSQCQLVAVDSAVRSYNQNAAIIASMPRRNGLYGSHDDTRTPATLK